MVADISYEEACNLLRPQKYVWLRDLATPRKELFNALKGLGIAYRVVHDNSFVDSNSLVFVQCDRTNHVVVYDLDGKRILDPWPDDPLDLEYCLANFTCAALIG
jgi:hypothetical protein